MKFLDWFMLAVVILALILAIGGLGYVIDSEHQPARDESVQQVIYHYCLAKGGVPLVNSQLQVIGCVR